MRRSVLIAYLVLIHGLLVLVLMKSDFLQKAGRKLGVTPQKQEIAEHYKGMLSFHVRMDGNVPYQAVVFIGDSSIQGLYADAVACPSVSYGIGSDTTVGVLRRLPHYRSLTHASAVVLAIGGNDMKYRDNQAIVQNYRRILQAIPQGVPVVCSAVLPVNETMMTPGGFSNARIRSLNAALQSLCTSDPRCIFLDVGSKLVDSAGNLSASFQDGDGLHLNSAGNQIWIDELRDAVKKAQQVGEANPVLNPGDGSQ